MRLNGFGLYTGWHTLCIYMPLGLTFSSHLSLLHFTVGHCLSLPFSSLTFLKAFLFILSLQFFTNNHTSNCFLVLFYEKLFRMTRGVQADPELDQPAQSGRPGPKTGRPDAGEGRQRVFAHKTRDRWVGWWVWAWKIEKQPTWPENSSEFLFSVDLSGHRSDFVLSPRVTLRSCRIFSRFGLISLRSPRIYSRSVEISSRSGLISLRSTKISLRSGQIQQKPKILVKSDDNFCKIRQPFTQSETDQYPTGTWWHPTTRTVAFSGSVAGPGLGDPIWSGRFRVGHKLNPDRPVDSPKDDICGPQNCQIGNHS